MTTSEERLKILRMIDDGKINAEEGAKLLSALSESRQSKSKSAVRSTTGGARWLRVRVTDMVTGKPKATGPAGGQKHGEPVTKDRGCRHDPGANRKDHASGT